jgi:hypothetical protein
VASNGEEVITASPDEFRTALMTYTQQQLQLIAKNYIGAIFKKIGEQLYLRTPVLTGHARRNWLPSVGVASGEEADGVAGVAATGDPLTEEEVTGMNDIVDQYSKGDLSQTLYFTNNVSYISILEHGNSKKAPEGIVEVGVQAALEDIKSNGVGT